MKIDELISSLSGEQAIVITSGVAIQKILDELSLKNTDPIGVFENPDKEYKITSLHRGGVEMFFVDEKHLDEKGFAALIKVEVK